MEKGKDMTNFFEQEWQMFKNKSPRHVRRSSRSFSHLTKQSTLTLVPHSALFVGIRVTSGRNALKDINRVAQLVGLLPTSFENVLNVTLCRSKRRCNGSPHVFDDSNHIIQQPKSDSTTWRPTFEPPHQARVATFPNNLPLQNPIHSLTMNQAYKAPPLPPPSQIDPKSQAVPNQTPTPKQPIEQMIAHRVAVVDTLPCNEEPSICGFMEGMTACSKESGDVRKNHQVKSSVDLNNDSIVKAAKIGAVEEICTNPENGVAPLKDPTQVGQLLYPVQLDGICAVALLDHGASVSFVDEKWMKNHGFAACPLKVPQRLCEFSGPGVLVTQSLNVDDLFLANCHRPWKFVVTP